MANEEHLKILKQGVEAWNKWREESPHVMPDLTTAKLVEEDLSGAAFNGAILNMAQFTRARLDRADLSGSYLYGANLTGARLTGAKLNWAHLIGAKLLDADLTGANLNGANITLADLTEAKLIRAKLSGATLLKTSLRGAQLVDCWVYGISAWDVNLEGATQRGLIITPRGEPTITVDDLEVAQFIYLLLKNPNVRKVIDTITTKVVLILGNFSKKRKPVLDAIKDELRQRGYVPVLFDFDGPENRDTTETVKTLALMSRFIIADVTSPRCIPHELAGIVSNQAVPMMPIFQSSEQESDIYSMFSDYWKFDWVLKPLRYTDADELIASFDKQIIAPVDAKLAELMERRGKRYQDMSPK